MNFTQITSSKYIFDDNSKFNKGDAEICPLTRKFIKGLVRSGSNNSTRLIMI